MSALLDKLDGLCKDLRLDALAPEEVYEKLADGMTPLETIIAFLEFQHQHRVDRAAAMRVRNARFPRIKTF